MKSTTANPSEGGETTEEGGLPRRLAGLPEALRAEVAEKIRREESGAARRPERIRHRKILFTIMGAAMAAVFALLQGMPALFALVEIFAGAAASYVLVRYEMGPLGGALVYGNGLLTIGVARWVVAGGLDPWSEFFIWVFIVVAGILLGIAAEQARELEDLVG